MNTISLASEAKKRHKVMIVDCETKSIWLYFKLFEIFDEKKIPMTIKAMPVQTFNALVFMESATWLIFISFHNVWNVWIWKLLQCKHWKWNRLLYWAFLNYLIKSWFSIYPEHKHSKPLLHNSSVKNHPHPFKLEYILA